MDDMHAMIFVILSELRQRLWPCISRNNRLEAKYDSTRWSCPLSITTSILSFSNSSINSQPGVSCMQCGGQRTVCWVSCGFSGFWIV
ncbi:hypothetical protein KC338_g286 [Hortaea werneckii]|nr:hypothetical protein KC338_g286 [Hortaea werneckii]